MGLKQWLFEGAQPKKFKMQKSAGKIAATVFLDAQGVILVDFLPRGKIKFSGIRWNPDETQSKNPMNETQLANR